MTNNIRFYPGKKMMQLKQNLMQYCDTTKKRHKSSLVLQFWPRLYLQVIFSREHTFRQFDCKKLCGFRALKIKVDIKDMKNHAKKTHELVSRLFYFCKKCF